MNLDHQDEDLILPRKRRLPRSLPPSQVADGEDPRGYSQLVDRIFEQTKPIGVLQEGDVVSIGQMRWSQERTNHIAQCEINQHIRVPMLQNVGDTSTRLMIAYRSCMNEKSFTNLIKQHQDSIKIQATLGGRVEKWSNPKPVRPKRGQEE